MSSEAMQMIKKRLIKPKTQFSPSNPALVMTMYHLIKYDDTGSTMIVGNSSVKRITKDGTVKLNDGHTAKLIVSGTKNECMEQWNKQTSSLESDSDCEQSEYPDDIPDLMESTIQMPTNMFSTPAPYRRQVAVVNRSASPDSILSVSSRKRFRRENQTTNSTKRRVGAAISSSASNRITTEASSMISSSEDEEQTTNSGDQVSLNRIFHELQNTQSNIRDARTENLDIHKQITKLTHKVNHFNSLVLSKNDNDLDRFRDSNDKEAFRDEIEHEGRNLLEVPGKNAGEYARNLLKILFQPHELQTSILPSRHSKRFSKPELDQRRLNLLNDAIRTRYRITKYHYASFYKEIIQVTLACCVYNEGRRKDNKQTVQDQVLIQQPVAQTQQQPITTAVID